MSSPAKSAFVAAGNDTVKRMQQRDIRLNLSGVKIKEALRVQIVKAAKGKE